MQRLHNAYTSCQNAYQAYSRRLAPLNLDSKEARITAAGLVTFAVTTVVLTYLLISQPQLNVAGFATLGALEIASVVATIVGLVLHGIKQKKALENYIVEIATAPVVKVEEVILEESEVASLDYIEQVRQELPPLFDGLEKFLLSFVAGHYKASGKRAENLDKVREAVRLIRTQIDEFLQNPQEVLRVAVGIAAYTLIDETKMGKLLNESESVIIAGLPDALAPAEEGFEQEVALTRQILQVLCQQADPTDSTLRMHIKEVKRNYTRMMETRESDEKTAVEAARDYQASIIGMIDYLYSHASLSEEKVDTWTSHLVPPFLENWRGSLFARIDTRMKTLHAAFGKEGILNDSGWRRTLSAARTWYGRPFVGGYIKKAVDPLPLIPERKVILESAVRNLFDAFIDPIVDGLFEKSHPYHKKVKGIIGVKDFSSPKIEGTEWKPYIDAYAEFFESLSTQLIA